MKKILLSLLLLPLSFYCFAQNNKQIKDYPAKKISEHVYVIHGPRANPSVENKGFMNNPAFIVTPKGVVVVDPGSSLYSGKMVIRQIKKVTQLPVTHVFNTHLHGDHWLGNDAIKRTWPKVQIYGHPEMIKKSKAGEAQNWIDLMIASTDGFTKETKIVLPNNSTDDQDKFKINGLTYKIYAPKKAHSGTDLMIEVVEDAVIFLGDNVTYKRVARMDDATFKGNINACDVALNTGAKVYVPGHGPTGGTEVVTTFRNLIHTVYSLTKKYYEDDMDDFEMKPLIIAKLKAYKTWSGFDGAIGRFISLPILEIEADF